MTDTQRVVQALDAALADAKVVEDLTKLLWAGDVLRAKIDLDGVQVEIPRNTPLQITTKAFFKEYFDVSFRTGYRVQVAIGGVREERFGILTAANCFATLYYDFNHHLFSVDFHREMR